MLNIAVQLLKGTIRLKRVEIKKPEDFCESYSY